MRNYVVKFLSSTADQYYAEKKASIKKWVLAEVSEYGNIINTGGSLDEFFKSIQSICGRITVIDLNFYGHFLLYWLYENGYTYNNKLNDSRTFDVWVNDVGTWYSLRVVYCKKNKKRFYSEFVDAHQKLIVSTSELPRAFGLNYEANTPELEAKATAQSLHALYKQGMKGITLSADCFRDYMTEIGQKAYKTYFPTLTDTVNEFVQSAYTGGYNYISPKYINKNIHASSYDENSMYSYQMSTKILPCGLPSEYRGAPPKSGLFVHRFVASFKLKSGMLPTLKLRDRLDVGTDYLIEQLSPIEITLTSVDYNLFLLHYDVLSIEHLGGYIFHGRNDLFRQYVCHWYDVKLYALSPASRTIAKHHLNHLYGVFGRSKTRRIKTPEYTDGCISWHSGLNSGKFGYIPIAAFVTAYSRQDIIRIAQMNYDKFVCACTDSIKIEYAPDSPPRGIDISNQIGAFKCEYSDAPFKILKTNTYAYIKDGDLNIVASGMTAEARKQITSIEQFAYDLTVSNPTTIPVRGGAIKILQQLILSAS